MKTVLMALVAAIGASSALRAVEISPDGTGQVLIYPYYTVNADNSTLLSVVNNSRRAKAVRVRFQEAYNGQETLSFNLFLSMYDVWTANVFALDASGPANLLTDDESCTLPDIKGSVGPGVSQLPAPDGRSYVPFKTGNFFTDGGPTTPLRTREGSIELIEMATIAAGSDLENAVVHDDGVPVGCSGLAAVIAAEPAALLRPAGGLFGSGSIVNPGLGTLIGYNADAVDGFYLLNGSLYTANGSDGPTLADARTTLTTADAHNQVPRSTDGPNELVTSTYSATQAIDAVSAVFTARRIANEYVIEANSASESEWVVTFPTKKFYVNTGSTPIAPFPRVFAAPGRSCVAVGLRYYDREERRSRNPFDCGFICPPSPRVEMCNQTNVLSFRTASDYAANGGISAVLGSRLTLNVDPRGRENFSSGWLELDLDPHGIDVENEPHALRPSQDTEIYSGLPVTGFLATNYLNRNNGGPNVLSTYSAGSRHRSLRECTKGVQVPATFCD